MRRVWVLLLPFAGLLPGANAVPAPAAPFLDATVPRKPELPRLPARLTVVAYGPRGDLEGRETAQIYVQFNQPVVVPGNSDKSGRDASRLLKLDPPVPGRAMWQAPDRLVWEPQGPMPVATGIRVSLEPPVRGLDGRHYDEPLAWTFETKRPVIDRWSLADDALIGSREPIVLQFSVAVAPEKVWQALHVQAGAYAWPFDLARPTPAEDPPPDTNADDDSLADWRSSHDHKIVIRPRTTWPNQARLTVTVAAAVLTSAGNLPMRSAWHRSFRVQPPPGFESAICEQAPGPLRITLATPLPPEARDKITVEPALTLQTEAVDADGGARWGAGHFRALVANGARADVTYRITLPAGVTDAFGQRTAKPLVRQIHCGWPRPGLALAAPSGILEAGKPRIIGVEARGVDRFILRAVVLNERVLSQVRWPFGDNDFLPQAYSVGLPVVSRVVTLQPQGPTRWSTFSADLGELAKQARRPVLVEVEPVLPLPPGAATTPDRRRALYQVTDMGVVAFHSVGRCLIRVVRLSTGAPVPGASVFESAANRPFALRGRTDAAGLLALDGSAAATITDGDPIFLVKSADGQDVAMLRAFPYPAFYERKDLLGLRPGETIIGTVLPDRELYAPGETVHLVGWLAIATPFGAAGVRPIRAGMPVALRLRQGNTTTIQEAFVTVQPSGKVWGDVPIPPRAALGWYSLDAQVGRIGAEDREEYLGQRWEYVGPVTIRVAAPPPPGLDIRARADHANVLRDAPVRISVGVQGPLGGGVRLTAAQYQLACEGSWRLKSAAPVTRPLSVDGDTARQGKLQFDVVAPFSDGAGPTFCAVTITVRDTSLREAHATIRFTAHPAATTLSVEPYPHTELHVGDPISIKIGARSLLQERVAVDGVMVSLRSSRGPIARWRVDVKDAGPEVSLPLPALAVGRYEVTAESPTAGNARALTATASIDVLETMVSGVAGLDRYREPVLRRSVPDRSLLKIAAAGEARVGRPLSVTITGPQRPPSAPLHGLLVATRGGVRQAMPFVLKDGQVRLDLSPTEAWVPEARLEAVAVLPATDAPASLIGDATLLAVSSEQRRLWVDLTVPARAQPGEEIAVALRVHGVQGAPKGASVTVWAVDDKAGPATTVDLAEQVSAVSSVFVTRGEPTALDHALAEILRPYQPHDSDRHLPLTEPPRWLEPPASVTLGPRGRPRPEPEADGSPASTLPHRADVPVAPDGTAHLKLRLPGAPGTFRVLAVASAPLPGAGAPGRFGLGAATIQTTLPLSVRGQLPRQVRPGDEIEMAAILVSAPTAEGAVIVKARLEGPGADDIAKIVSAPVVHTVIGRGDSRRVAFRLRAGIAGQVNLRFEAQFRPGSDGSTMDSVLIPVVVAAEPTRRERLAVWGSTDVAKDVVIPVRLPAGTWQRDPEDRVEVTLAPSLAGSLQSAVAEILKPSSECLELVASRLVPLLTFPDLSRAALGDRDPRQFAREQLSQMLAFQLGSADGSSHWRGSSVADPYATAFAALVTQRAREAGYLPEDRNPNEGRYLELLVEEPKWLEGQPRATDAVKAMALFALASMERWEDETQVKLDDLYLNRRNLPPGARAFLLMALHRRAPRDGRTGVLQGELMATVAETLPGIAHVMIPEGAALVPGYPSASPDFTEAAVLWALARSQKGSPLVVNLARGLAERRHMVGWDSAHDGAVALLALSQAAQSQPATTDLSLRAGSSVGGSGTLGSVRLGNGCLRRR